MPFLGFLKGYPRAPTMLGDHIHTLPKNSISHSISRGGSARHGAEDVPSCEETGWSQQGWSVELHSQS